MKNKKFAKIIQTFEAIKKDKIKETQDSWRRQFEMTEQEKLQYNNIEKKYNRTTEQNYGQEEEQDARTEEERQEEYLRQFKNQKYADVDGQKIFLGGLDIRLLKEQKQQLKKQNDLSSITNKINLAHQKHVLNEKVQKIGKNKIYKTMVENIMHPPPTKREPCPITLDSYYQFDIDYNFGNVQPSLVTKKLGKFHQHPIHSGINDSMVEGLVKILNKPKEQTKNNNVMADDDSDDIFGNTVNSTSMNIEVGKKLEFGIAEDINQIMAKKNIHVNSIEQQDQEEELQKLQALKKKRKMLLEDNNNQDYMQCYWNTGPTLEQMVELKKDGIVIQYQQKKEFKKKQKKVNYNRQYQKIQRVIKEQEDKKKG